MRRLYLRFFDDATKTVPVNSELVGKSSLGTTDLALAIQDWADEIVLWMKRNPEGKTDFVWLP